METERDRERFEPRDSSSKRKTRLSSFPRSGRRAWYSRYTTTSHLIIQRRRVVRLSPRSNRHRRDPSDRTTVMDQASAALVEQGLLQVAQNVEEQLDAQIHQLENLGEDDLERIRRRRMDEYRR